MANGRFEIWFLQADEISVLIKKDLGRESESGQWDEVRLMETAVFAALTAGVIANLPKHLGEELSTRLAEFPLPTRDKDGVLDLPGSVDNFLLVSPRPERGRKGFESTVVMKGPVPFARMKTRGFRMFGRAANCEVQECSQTATMAVLLDMLAGSAEAERVMFVEAAHVLGNLGRTVRSA